MRKFFWFGLGVCAAAFFRTRWMWQRPLLLPVAATVALLLVLPWGLRFRRVQPAIPMLLGLLLGSLWTWNLQRVYYTPLYELDGRTVSGEILLTDYPVETRYGYQAAGSLNWQGAQYGVLVYLKEGDAGLGSLLKGDFTLQLTLPGGSKASATNQGKGIFALVKPKGGYTVSAEQSNHFRFFPRHLAKNIEEVLDAALSEDTAPLAKALFLGNTAGLRYAEKTALTLSGLRHTAAVSGLHVGILYGAVCVLTGRRRLAVAIAGAPVLLLFAAVAGFSPSVCRASLMMGMVMLAAILRAEYDGLTGLAVAAVTLLTWNPFTVQNAGFQLSALSVLGILLFQPRYAAAIRERWSGRRRRYARMVAQSLSLTLSATSLSAPVAACYFGVFSLVAPLSNLLCLPLVTISFYGIGLTCVAAPLWFPAAKGLGWLTSRLLGLLRLAAVWLSRIPGAALYTVSPYAVAFLIVLYIVVFFWSVFRFRGGKRCVLVLLAAYALCMGLAVWLPRQDECRLTVVDVGQGQCLVFQSRGEAMVVDCGGWSDETAADAAAERLLSQGIRRIEALALTHYDRDHAGGVEDLLTRIRAKRLFLPGKQEGLTYAAPEQVVAEPLTMVLGSGMVHFYPYAGDNSAHENSMALLFETENCAILVTGDLDAAGERALLRTYEIPPVDILVVGHHGSKTSTAQELLDRVRPKAAVISVGENNSYGHPTQQVLDRLSRAGCRIYRTDQQGTIIFRR